MPTDDPEKFSLDPVLMDLLISSLPLHQNWQPTTTEYWLKQADRDIYLETVDAHGFDPLERSDSGT